MPAAVPRLRLHTPLLTLPTEPAPPSTTPVQVKAAFRANAGIQGQDALLRKVHEGRWWVGEMVGVIRLRKYRSLRQSYGVGSDLPFDAGKEALDISKDTKRAETAAAVGAAAAVAEAQAAAAAAAGAGATGSRSSSA